MKLGIDIPDKDYDKMCKGELVDTILVAIKNGKPLTPDTLANMLMEERISGELKQDMCYTKDVIDNVRCKLTVDIVDHRPCYCGAELTEVWRKEKQ